MLIWALLLVASGVAAQEPNCDAPAPCQAFQQLAVLATSQANATLFADADMACGGNAVASLTSAATSCISELDVPAGCPCTTPSCIQSMATVNASCVEALVDLACDNAFWMDMDLGVNLRGVFLHLGNDCRNSTTELACAPDVPPFDPQVCAAGGPAAGGNGTDTGTAPGGGLAPPTGGTGTPLLPPATPITGPTIGEINNPPPDTPAQTETGDRGTNVTDPSAAMLDARAVVTGALAVVAFGALLL